MSKILFLLLLCVSCTGNKQISFDPFNHDPGAYEEVKLNYAIKGAGDTTLFFIHGWNLDATYWQNQVTEFSSAYKLVLLDLAGHGLSGKHRNNWTIESFARDMEWKCFKKAIKIISKQ